MTDDVVIDLREDWEFHQATGMVSVQMGTPDVERGARRIVAVAAERGESAHEIAILVIERQLRLCEANEPAAADDAPDSGDGELRTVREELDRLLHQSLSWSYEGDEANRYTKLARLEVLLRGLAAEERPETHPTDPTSPG